MSVYKHSPAQITAKFDYSAYTRTPVFNHQAHWLRETLGEQGQRWEYSRAKFYFKTEQDYLLFVLRWA